MADPILLNVGIEGQDDIVRALQEIARGADDAFASVQKDIDKLSQTINALSVAFSKLGVGAKGAEQEVKDMGTAGSKASDQLDASAEGRRPRRPRPAPIIGAGMSPIGQALAQEVEQTQVPPAARLAPAPAPAPAAAAPAGIDKGSAATAGELTDAINKLSEAIAKMGKHSEEASHKVEHLGSTGAASFKVLETGVTGAIEVLTGGGFNAAVSTLHELGEAAEGAGKHFGTLGEEIGSAALSLGKWTLGVGTLVGALFELANHAKNDVIEIDNLANAMGTSAGVVIALRDTMAGMGVSLEEMGGIFTRISIHIQGAWQDIQNAIRDASEHIIEDTIAVTEAFHALEQAQVGVREAAISTAEAEENAATAAADAARSAAEAQVNASEAALDAQKEELDASFKEADAQRSYEEAVIDASEAVIHQKEAELDAQNKLADAQRAYADAVVNANEAQLNLADAQKDYQYAGDDAWRKMADAIDAVADAERKAADEATAVQEAMLSIQEAATSVKSAYVSLYAAQLAYREAHGEGRITRAERQELRREQTEVGLESAQERLQSAKFQQQKTDRDAIPEAEEAQRKAGRGVDAAKEAEDKAAQQYAESAQRAADKLEKAGSAAAEALEKVAKAALDVATANERAENERRRAQLAVDAAAEKIARAALDVEQAAQRAADERARARLGVQGADAALRRATFEAPLAQPKAEDALASARINQASVTDKLKLAEFGLIDARNKAVENFTNNIQTLRQYLQTGVLPPGADKAQIRPEALQQAIMSLTGGKGLAGAEEFEQLRLALHNNSITMQQLQAVLRLSGVRPDVMTPAFLKRFSGDVPFPTSEAQVTPAQREEGAKNDEAVKNARALSASEREVTQRMNELAVAMGNLLTGPFAALLKQDPRLIFGELIAGAVALKLAFAELAREFTRITGLGGAAGAAETKAAAQALTGSAEKQVGASVGLEGAAKALTGSAELLSGSARALVGASEKMALTSAAKAPLAGAATAEGAAVGAKAEEAAAVKLTAAAGELTGAAAAIRTAAVEGATALKEAAALMKGAAETETIAAKAEITAAEAEGAAAKAEMAAAEAELNAARAQMAAAARGGGGGGGGGILPGLGGGAGLAAIQTIINGVPALGSAESNASIKYLNDLFDNLPIIKQLEAGGYLSKGPQIGGEEPPAAPPPKTPVTQQTPFEKTTAKDRLTGNVDDLQPFGQPEGGVIQPDAGPLPPAPPAPAKPTHQAQSPSAVAVTPAVAPDTSAQTSAKVDELNQKLSDQTQLTQTLTEKDDNISEKMGELTDAIKQSKSDESKGSAEVGGDKMNVAADKLQEAAIKLDEAASKMGGAVGAAPDAGHRTEENAKDAIDKIKESIDKLVSGKGLIQPPKDPVARTEYDTAVRHLIEGITQVNEAQKGLIQEQTKATAENEKLTQEQEKLTAAQTEKVKDEAQDEEKLTDAQIRKLDSETSDEHAIAGAQERLIEAETEKVNAETQAIQNAQSHAEGGIVSGPGGPKDDAVPIMASAGEFVVNAEDTAKNRGALEAINAGKTPHFATGGVVGSAPQSAGTGGEPLVASMTHLVDRQTHLVERQEQVTTKTEKLVEDQTKLVHTQTANVKQDQKSDAQGKPIIPGAHYYHEQGGYQIAAPEEQTTPATKRAAMTAQSSVIRSVDNVPYAVPPTHAPPPAVQTAEIEDRPRAEAAATLESKKAEAAKPHGHFLGAQLDQRNEEWRQRYFASYGVHAREHYSEEKLKEMYPGGRPPLSLDSGLRRRAEDYPVQGPKHDVTTQLPLPVERSPSNVGEGQIVQHLVGALSQALKGTGTSGAEQMKTVAADSAKEHKEAAAKQEAAAAAAKESAIAQKAAAAAAKEAADAAKEAAAKPVQPAAHASGGPVVGPGGIDKVPIMATAGEYVVNADSTSKHRGLLEQINDGGELRFALGGEVPNLGAMIHQAGGTMPSMGALQSGLTSNIGMGPGGYMMAKMQSQMNQSYSVDLRTDHGTYAVLATEDQMGTMLQGAIGAKMISTGPKPSWWS